MELPNLSLLFQKCLYGPFIHAENSADYYIERERDRLYLFLECSSGEEDWKNNFDFPAAPYKRMESEVWFCHRGFLRVWKSIEDEISTVLSDANVHSIVISGYSHGAALGTLCHEYVWYNRPDLRDNIRSFGFGAPRVIWGLPSRSVRERFSGYTMIRNVNDIVTHLPPKLFGYTHVGELISIGERGKYSGIDAHRPENILRELIIYENKKPTQGSS